MRKALRVVLIVPTVGLLALIAIGTAIPASHTASPTPYSPLATVDDVYAALTAELHATPDFETQVKPVLALGLSYRELQSVAQASGGLMGAVAAAATAAPPAPVAPTQAAVAQPATGPAVPAAPIAVPNTARTVPMTSVLNIVRSQWAQQPQPVCFQGMTCQPLFTQLTSIGCDRTGDVAVPATVSCTYRDSTLTGTIAITIDSDNIVRWRGCSTSTRFLPYCAQAAPTPAPVVAPAPANAPAASCGGIGYITVAITDSRPHPVAIWIDGQRVSDNIVNAWRVAAGSHTVLYRYADGSQVISSQYVGDCKSWLIRVT